MRVILVTGKGGVGKTTVAAATALRSADFGHRTLVMSTDPAHSLADAYQVPLGDSSIEIVERLEAQQIDAATCEHILGKSTTLKGEEACGARAINGLMASAQARELEVSLLHACNSGDTAGAPNRVVGYAAFALH